MQTRANSSFHVQNTFKTRSIKSETISQTSLRNLQLFARALPNLTNHQTGQVAESALHNPKVLLLPKLVAHMRICVDAAATRPREVQQQHGETFLVPGRSSVRLSWFWTRQSQIQERFGPGRSKYVIHSLLGTAPTSQNALAPASSLLESGSTHNII